MQPTFPEPTAQPHLTPAQRARTVLASLPCLTWSRDGEPIAVPFVEEVGSPMLVVSAELSEQLLGARECRVELRGSDVLGSLRLSGQFWPVAEDASMAWLRSIWAEHATCGADCSGRATHLVGLQVERVEVLRPGRLAEVVDLDAYQQASPDPLLSQGLTLAAHLNAEHLDELVETAEWLTRTADLLAARIEHIDAAGVELMIIDRSGSRRRRFDFPHPVRRPDELVGTVHRMFQHAAVGRRAE